MPSTISPSSGATTCDLSSSFDAAKPHHDRSDWWGWNAMLQTTPSPIAALMVGLGDIHPMPAEGKLWRHVIISTLNSWLPGDPRGFRAVNHKIHSSGDYKNPPPGEHAGLL